ncbi:MAG: peptidoglycan DD-metalloendopeptidase family protein [Firmicutes bacterium]|nr:peptidoglycan DD-metalloendopeptidase family protein [Bacillota bacterium]
MRKHICIITALIMALTMCFGTVSVSAKSLTQLQKEIKEKKQELAEGKKKEAGLTEDIKDLEKSISQLDDQIQEGEARLTVLEKELAEAQKKVDEQNENLSDRLRTMYKNGNIGFMDVLLNSGSFSEFLTNLDLVQIVYASDEEVLMELQEAHDEVEKKKNQVETLQANLKSSKALAKEEKAEVEEQKEQISADNEENAKLLDNMEKEAEQIAAELAAKSKSGAISNSSTSKYSGGVFCWPAPSSSKITSGYGVRNCPFHGKEFHPAIDIGALSGSAVLAAADGTVITSCYKASFGNCIIIDHGGGVTTWYNHLSSRLVSVGATVSKGQQIGKVGSTGDSTGPHLDFRVYVNGSAQDPLSYF